MDQAADDRALTASRRWTKWGPAAAKPFPITTSRGPHAFLSIWARIEVQAREALPDPSPAAANFARNLVS